MSRIVQIVFVLLFSSFAQAQNTQFGIKAGINLAGVEISNGNDYETKVGMHLGALAHIHITKEFAVQPELVYSMQGGQSGDVKLQLGYLNVPVLVQYMVNYGFRLETGPQFGFLLSAESKVGDVEVDVDDDVSAIDISWAFGLGYIFPSGIGIDTRFNVGLNNISDIDDFKAHNRVFQVGLFYQFAKKH